MTRRKRRNHSSAFKAKVALSALKGERTEAEFAEVNGVGAAKLKQFAEPFLAAINGAPCDAGRSGSPG